MTTKLSEHFTLEEMTYSATAVKKGLINIPSKAEIKNLKELCTKILEPLRKEIGLPIKINSGYRSVKVNAAVGGVSTSAHVFGYAADIVCPQYGNAKEFTKYVADFLKRNNIAFDQCILEFDTWCHIGIRHQDGRQRKQLLTIRKKQTLEGIV